MSEENNQNSVCIKKTVACLNVVPVKISSDIRFNYDYESCELTIGTIANNYLVGHCAVYDRSTSFSIRDVNQINEFKVTKVGFDDYLQIKVNGHVLYVGPDGGDQLTVKPIQQATFSKSTKDNSATHAVAMVYNGIDYKSCERGADSIRAVDIDLKPLLVSGNNMIDTRVIVGGSGEGWLKIIATGNYCDEYEVHLSGVNELI